jgi:hypothetical protein
MRYFLEMRVAGEGQKAAAMKTEMDYYHQLFSEGSLVMRSIVHEGLQSAFQTDFRR